MLIKLTDFDFIEFDLSFVVFYDILDFMLKFIVIFFDVLKALFFITF